MSVVQKMLRRPKGIRSTAFTAFPGPIGRASCILARLRNSITTTHHHHHHRRSTFVHQHLVNPLALRDHRAVLLVPVPSISQPVLLTFASNSIPPAVSPEQQQQHNACQAVSVIEDMLPSRQRRPGGNLAVAIRAHDLGARQRRAPRPNRGGLLCVALVILGSAARTSQAFVCPAAVHAGQRASPLAARSLVIDKVRYRER